VSNDETSGEVKNRPISFLKRGNSIFYLNKLLFISIVCNEGNTFGDNALLDNSKRTSTVISNGENTLGLIAIYKQYFHLFYPPKHNIQDRDIFLNSNVPIFKTINYPSEVLQVLPEKYIFTVYYKKGN
jgi:hypothetical protein